jgi:hypothetical protein
VPDLSPRLLSYDGYVLLLPAQGNDERYYFSRPEAGEEVVRDVLLVAKSA